MESKAEVMGVVFVRYSALHFRGEERLWGRLGDLGEFGFRLLAGLVCSHSMGLSSKKAERVAIVGMQVISAMG